MSLPTDNLQEVPILLLGDGGVGKSTFLSCLKLGSNAVATQWKELPVLRDLDQPFCFNIRLHNQHFQLQFYDTASPTNYTLLTPSVIVLCYSIAVPESLISVQGHWTKLVETHFNYDERLPVILLGLMRDVRQKEDYDGKVRRKDHGGMGESDVLNGRRLVYPQEAVRVAQEMRCDRYCECSALTGDLCSQVLEDLAKTAVLTTTARGGRSPGTKCAVM